MADGPEQLDYTSIQQGIRKATLAHLPNHPQQQRHGLLAFAGNPRDNMPSGLPFDLTDYFELAG